MGIGIRMFVWKQRYDHLIQKVSLTKNVLDLFYSITFQALAIWDADDFFAESFDHLLISFSC